MSAFIFWALVVLLIILVVFSYIFASFGLAFIFGAPYVGTSRKMAQEMLEFAGIKEADVVMDIGSGSGTILLTAVQKYGARKAIGYEINPFLVWITRIRAYFAGISDKIEVKRVNFFKTDIEQADIVAFYLLQGAMNKLYERLNDQLAPGTRLISRGFEFNQIKPSKSTKDSSSSYYLYVLTQ